MAGQGRPRTSSRPVAAWRRRLSTIALRTLAALWALSLLCRPSMAGELALRLRIAWGGGVERQWSGTIALSSGALADPRAMGIEADEPGSMWLQDGKLVVASRSARAYDGVDLTVNAPADAKLLVSLVPLDSSAALPPIEVPLSELTTGQHNAALDDKQNRLLLRRAPGDNLHVEIDPRHRSLVFAPGETLRFHLSPRQLGQPPDTRIRFEMQLLPARGGEPLWTKAEDTEVDGPKPARFAVETPLPAGEGVYDLVIVAKLRNRLRLWQTLGERRIQAVVIDPELLPAPPASDQTFVELARINPVEPVNPNWWTRFANLSLLPNARKDPRESLSTNQSRSWRHPALGLKMLELGSASGQTNDVPWEAYPLPIERPGEPHVLELEFPGDVPQCLGVSIVEPNSAGAILPIGVDSGAYRLEGDLVGPAKMQTHRFVFWPRTKSPLVLVTNRRGETRAVYGSLKLLGGQTRLPRALPRDEPAGRLLAGCMLRPLFPENFSADEALDSWSARSLDDWTTFHQGGQRLIDHLTYSGCNGLMLSVLADGSTIYPSELLQPTPRFDTGAFLGDGRDPLRKDALEMLLRMFDRERLRLIPMLQFASPLPELEAELRRGGPDCDGLAPVGVDGLPILARRAADRGLAPYYNVLHPRVQEAMLNVVRELTARCAGHPSFAGVSLDLSPQGYAQLPGAEWGFDDVTVAAFEQDHPRLNVPGIGDDRYAQRARFLCGEQRAAWVKWRAERLAAFYAALEREVAGANPDAKLYLASGALLTDPDAQRRLRPGLNGRPPILTELLERGLSPEMLKRLDRTVLLRPRIVEPAFSPAAHAGGIELNAAFEIDAALAGGAVPGAFNYHPPQESRLESFDAKGPFKKSYTLLVSQMLPAGDANRRRFTETLAAMDSREMFEGGWLLPLGQESQLGDWARTYRRLPAAPMETLRGDGGPVTIRTLSHDGRTTVCLMNESPWTATVSMRAELPLGCRVQTLDPSHPQPTLERGSQGASLRVTVPPYGLEGIWFSSPGVQVSSPRTELPPAALATLALRMSDLGNRASSLANPPPLLETPANRGFEAVDATAKKLVNWCDAQHPGAIAAIDATNPHGGKQAVRLTSTGPEAWLRSDPLAPPRTGRLAISVWLRVADERKQPPLRLAMEYRHEGREHYRHASVGLRQGGQRGVPLKTEWDWYVFQVSDLPAQGVADLRVRFDLMGPGEVWVDDVQLFDLVFSEDERTALNKLIYVNTCKLQEGKTGDCLRFLNEYWPQFLTAYVTPTPETSPVAPPAERTATQPATPPKEKPGIFDRLKGVWPTRSWF